LISGRLVENDLKQSSLKSVDRGVVGKEKSWIVLGGTKCAPGGRGEGMTKWNLSLEGVGETWKTNVFWGLKKNKESKLFRFVES